MGIAPEARPADDEARAKWRSGQNRSAPQAEKRFWEPQEGRCRRFKFSTAASVGASVLCTEVSTGHPRPVASTIGKTVTERLLFFCYSLFILHHSLFIPIKNIRAPASSAGYPDNFYINISLWLADTQVKTESRN